MVKRQQRPTVAVIGGGIAGLSCAQQLSGSFDVTVYDTGRLRPGGRCSNRNPNDASKENDSNARDSTLSRYRYDHAAQILTLPESDVYTEFGQQVKAWVQEGIIKPFPFVSVYNIYASTSNQPARVELIPHADDGTARFYHGTMGMGSIATAMVQQRSFELKQDVWVSPSNGVRYMNPKWKVQGNGGNGAMYDYLVIAHNGKCADRLTSRTPATRLHELLRVNFAPTVPAQGGQRMTLNSLYSLTIAVPKSTLSRHLPETFMVGFVHHPALRFITCQTRKYASEDDVEVWTILSSATFAKKYKAPQEFLPEETVQRVTTLMLSALEEALGIVAPTAVSSSQSSQPSLSRSVLESSLLDSRLQLWGAAVPLNVWNTRPSDPTHQPRPAGFLYDAPHQMGACGDWLLDASIAGAWTSGRLLAHHLCLQDTASQSHGLEGVFQKSQATAQVGIGALPTLTKRAVTQ